MWSGIPGLSWLAGAGVRLRIALVYGAIAAALALIGTVLLTVALYLWLATLMPPAEAALITGAALLLAAALVTLIGRLALRARRPLASVWPREPRAGVATEAATMASVLGSELGLAGGTWVRTHLPQVAVAALAAGFLVGVSPRLRSAIRRNLGY